MCTGHCSAEDSRETLYTSSEFFLSLYAAFSSQVLCLTNSSHVGRPGHLAPSPQRRKTARLCSYLKISRLIVGFALFVSSPSVIPVWHCRCSMSENRCLYIPSGILVVSGRWVKQVFVAASLLKERVSQLILILRAATAWSEMSTVQPSRTSLIYPVA